MSIVKPRPSSLPMMEACPRWVSRPKTEEKDSLDEAADEGTLIHEKLDSLADVPVTDWHEAIENDPSLPPTVKWAVTEAATEVAPFFGMGLKVFTKKSLDVLKYELANVVNPNSGDGIYCEAGVYPEVCQPGTLDLVVVEGNLARLRDYKSNRVVRSHDAQQLAYVLGVFNALPQVQFVESGIVAPRLKGVHANIMYSRAELDLYRASIGTIVTKSEDPFEPGAPGDQCVFCAGNGRCPYQAASLKDIIEPEGALIPVGAWRSLMDPNITLEQRGWRRGIAKQMELYSEAIKEDDKEWAEKNPGVMPTGWTVSIASGRLSLDKDRLAEVNEKIRLTFGLQFETMEAFMVPEKKRIAAYVSMAKGISEEDALKEIDKAMALYMKRGADTIRFVQEKVKKQIKS